jgi:vitamin B12 transport system permease protein
MLDYAHRQHRSDRRRLLLLVLLLIVAAGVSLCAGDRWMGPESWLGLTGSSSSGKFVCRAPWR